MAAAPRRWQGNWTSQDTCRKPRTHACTEMVPGVQDEGEKALLLKQLTELEDLLRLQSQLVELERQKACDFRDLTHACVSLALKACQALGWPQPDGEATKRPSQPALMPPPPVPVKAVVCSGLS